LEEARLRTARVLANVATGVIAVDDGLRVTMANPRASELVLGGTETLSPGNVLPQATAAGWAPVWQAVAEFIAASRDVIQDGEFEVAGRQIRVQFARSEEHTSELQSRVDLVCRLLLEKKKLRIDDII